MPTTKMSGVSEGPDGTLTRMVRTKDSWFWMIPLKGNTTSIGVVMDTEKFRSMKMSPEEALWLTASRNNRWSTNGWKKPDG